MWLSHSDIYLYCKSLEDPPKHIKDYMPTLEQRAKEEQAYLEEREKQANEAGGQPQLE